MNAPDDLAITVTGRQTPAHKLAARDAAIRRTNAGRRVRRNDKTIALEAKKLQLSSLAQEPSPETIAARAPQGGASLGGFGDLSGDALHEKNLELRKWLGKNASWFDCLSAQTQQGLLDQFWRYAQGLMTWKAFRAVADSARITVEGAPVSLYDQRAQHVMAMSNLNRTREAPPSGGW
jgi:hypothetical protein